MMLQPEQSLIILLDDALMRTRDHRTSCWASDIYFYMLPVTCIPVRLILFSFSLIPVNKRSRVRLRREKVKEQEERQEAGSRGREVESQARRDKKEAARDLVPKCQFLLPHSAAS